MSDVSAQTPSSKDQAGAGSTDPFIRLSQIGVRYRLFTDQDRFLKSRLLGAVTRRRRAANEFWALQGINFEISRGQVVGILGPNGAGKSTLLRVIAGILEPSEGRIETHGRLCPILDLSSALHPELTGRENAYLYGALHRLPREAISEFLPEVIEFSELGSFFDIPLKAYSSGMVARLSFSLAAQLRPEILLLDEVLSVGDEHFQRKSLLRMQKLISKGSLVVIVSHNSAFLENLCTRLILLAHGRIVADGKPANISAHYRREYT